MSFFVDLYKRITGTAYDQTWVKVDWQKTDAEIAAQINELLADGANPSETDENHVTLLKKAISAHKYQSAEILATQLLAKNPKHTQAVLAFCDLIAEHNKYTLLEKKKQQKSEDPMMTFDALFQKEDIEKIEHLMEVMLQHKFPVNAAQKWHVAKNGNLLAGCDALYLAAEAGNLRLVQFLHQHGAPLNRTDSFSDDRPKYKSCVTAAVRSGNLAVLDYLYKNGAQIDPLHVAEGDFTPLAMAVICQNEEMADFIFDKKVNVNALIGKRKWTALMCAAIIEDEKQAQKWADKLIAKGADVRIKNAEGQTAQQIATAYFKKEKLSQKLGMIAQKQTVRGSDESFSKKKSSFVPVYKGPQIS